ncbi:hypothetical protein VNI00_018989 [Paramarasmius palmivorus]|uniref:Uncharacterized protein n=1 Tax=Paramarasmius palmivorus TaxID=297713 RepID=A0AAW0ASW5_9AGAR
MDTDDTEKGDDTYQSFVNLVEDGYLGFINISGTLCMVQGFDQRKKEGTAERHGNTFDVSVSSGNGSLLA